MIVNRERGALIDKGLRSELTADESARLDKLQRVADQHLEEVAPRPAAALEALEAIVRSCTGKT